MARVVLVGSCEQLPALFPFQCWEALSGADLIWMRHPDSHPSAPFLRMVELPVARLEPAGIELSRMDLTLPGSPQDRRYAQALLDLAEVEGTAVYLLGPDDTDAFTRTVGMEAARSGAEVEFVFHLPPAGVQVVRLAEVERALRDPEHGCPWDLEQDHASLGRYLVEETYELLEAIDSGDDAAIAEELGDVLLQVVFHAQIASDRGAFDLDDVARGIADKLVRRHPHVFADVEVTGAQDVIARWDVLKQEEKQRTGPFEGIPSALPALTLAEKLQRRASKLGFDWADATAPAERVRQELDELLDAGDGDRRAHEVGDLLSAVVATARHVGVDPEAALRGAATRFQRRFEAVLAAAQVAGHDPADLDRDGWLALWEQVKRSQR